MSSRAAGDGDHVSRIGIEIEGEEEAEAEEETERIRDTSVALIASSRQLVIPIRGMVGVASTIP